MGIRSLDGGAGRSFDRDYPKRDRARRVHDGQLLQRAVEAYRFFYPTVSMEGAFNGIREVGVEDGKGITVLVAGPRHRILTSNSDTPYAAGVLDLGRTGPVVIEVPPGPFVGVVDDHHHRWVADIGLPGPDGGRGGSYLIVPPDHSENVPAHAWCARSPTNKALLGLRAVPTKNDVAGAFAALRCVKVHPLGEPDAAVPFVDVTERDLDATALRWENDLEFWKRLHAIIEDEPVLTEFRPMYGELAALGIARGRPFPTDLGIVDILERAAAIALEQMRVEAFASKRADRLVWQDRQWEWVALGGNVNFEAEGYLDLEARDRWFIQAAGASPAIFRRRAGVGSIYFLSARDGAGAYLDGRYTYRLSVPLPVPADLFWSVTVYDAHTRTQIRTPQGKAVLGSLSDRIGVDEVGSIDLYFAPTPPPNGKAARWIQTTPGEGFFLYFRIHGPSAASLDGSWRLGNLVRMEER